MSLTVQLLTIFLQLLKENVNKIKPEMVKTKTGVGIFLDYSTILKEKFEILFYVFEDGNSDLGYWDNDNKLLYVNILDNAEFTNIIKTKKYSMLFDIYSSVIFHELIHRFDHMRYSGTHKPVDRDAYVNTYEEFNAFYQQYARSVDILVSKMKTIDDFYKRFGISAAMLIDDFWKIVPDDMKKEIKSSNKWNNKWNKRLYQLYYEKLAKFQNRNKEPLI